MIPKATRTALLNSILDISLKGRIGILFDSVYKRLYQNIKPR